LTVHHPLITIASQTSMLQLSLRLSALVLQEKHIVKFISKSIPLEILVFQVPVST